MQIKKNISFQFINENYDEYCIHLEEGSEVKYVDNKVSTTHIVIKNKPCNTSVFIPLSVFEAMVDTLKLERIIE